MASKAFDGLPSFPDNVQTAEMTTISLSKLLADDVATQATLFRACCELGFFMLDLRDHETGEQMIDEIDQLFGLAKEVMDLELEEKKKFVPVKPLPFGYKVQGAFKTETGQPDRCEMYNIGQDDLLGNMEKPFTNAAPIEAKRELAKSFVEHSQQVVSHINSALAAQLHLPQPTTTTTSTTTFQEMQSPQRRSTTIVRLIRYPASVVAEDMRTGLLPHTDYGSITLLANVLGGLQVLEPGRREAATDEEEEEEEAGCWSWVKPQRGHLIVNMGDAMTEWTAGVLRSNVHRVNHAPGDQRLVDRYSVALLVRPNTTASMARLVGGLIPTIEEDRAAGAKEEAIGALADVTAGEWEWQKIAGLLHGKNLAASIGGRKPREASV